MPIADHIAYRSTVGLKLTVNDDYRCRGELTDHVDKLNHSHAELDVNGAGQIAHRTYERIVRLSGEQILYQSHLIRTTKA